MFTVFRGHQGFQGSFYSNTYLIDYTRDRLSFHVTPEPSECQRRCPTGQHADHPQVKNTIKKSSVPIDWKAAAYGSIRCQRKISHRYASAERHPYGLNRGDMRINGSCGRLQWEQDFTASTDGYSILSKGITRPGCVYQRGAGPAQRWAIRHRHACPDSRYIH